MLVTSGSVAPAIVVSQRLNKRQVMALSANVGRLVRVPLA